MTGLAGCTTAPPTADEGSGAETTRTPTEAAAIEGDDEGEHHDEMPHEDGAPHDEGEIHEDETPHEEEGHMHDETLVGPVDHADVAMLSSSTGEHFQPHISWVTVGGTVTWTKESGIHSTTSYSPENDRPRLTPDGVDSWDSGFVAEDGTTFEHTFEKEGVYHYFCIPHEFVGMIGSVIVGNPNPETEPALAAPPESLPSAIRERIAELNEMIVAALSDDE
ncbi:MULTISPECIES: plastocyanin/azurin family copper-binding protein [Haloferax]|uniref:cupredoxin domain-containing protein n=1 Tax=Haloferax TaxID=2251 RepID=UPI001CDA1EEB|nr:MULTISPECIES: plastocyanin/azurin family copper-binding protein [Haloferax]